MAENYEDLTAFNDSVARFEALETKPTWDYSWRTPEASRAAVDYVRRMLHKHPDASHRVYQGIRHDGQGTLWDAVVAKDGTVLGAFNDSFLCPPWCG